MVKQATTKGRHDTRWYLLYRYTPIRTSDTAGRQTLEIKKNLRLSRAPENIANLQTVNFEHDLDFRTAPRASEKSIAR